MIPAPTLRTLALLLLSCCCVLTAQPTDARITVQERTSEVGERIVISGSTGKLRGELLRIAQRQREQLYALLGLADSSQQHQITVQLYGTPGDPAPAKLLRQGFTIVQGQISLNLAVHLAHGIHEELLEQALVQLLLYEMGLRDKTFTPDDALTLSLRPWLVQGIREAMQWQDDRADRALYARLFQQQSIYPLDTLLAEEQFNNDLEALDVAFRVSSGALVMALMNQPQGKAGLTNLIKEAASYAGEPRNLLTKHFPKSTLSKNSLAKWWALQLASMSQAPAEELLTIAQSEAELQSALIVNIRDADGRAQSLPPARYLELTAYPKNAQQISVAQTYNRLALLQSRVFPSYRPIIGGYLDVLYKIIDAPAKKRRGLLSLFSRKRDTPAETAAQMLHALTAERQIISKLGERTTDYLNWYSLERPEQQGEQFQDYLKLKERLSETSSSDGGPISQYLDAIEALYTPAN